MPGSLALLVGPDAGHLGVDHGVRDAVATLEPGAPPKIRSIIVMGMPYPPAPHQGSIFENQKLVKGRSFAKMM